ncbi:ABC transporter permease [Bacteroidota bacterium]
MTNEKWDNVIRPKRGLLDVNLREIGKYFDLLLMFVKRDLVVNYKQTILGPTWFVIQPILTTLIFVVVFGNIAGIPTDGIPKPLFYLAGIVIWNFFSECFTKTSDTFTLNADMFGKVYFPRLIQPLSVVMSTGVKFLIQFGLFLSIYSYFLINGSDIRPTSALALLPVLVALMAILGLGFGLIFSSLTTKYKDLKFLILFGVQLLMYATPVIYPISEIPEKYRPFIMANPLSHIVETFKVAFLGHGVFSIWGLLYSSCFAIVLLTIGILIFNRTEKNFMDTV